MRGPFRNTLQQALAAVTTLLEPDAEIPVSYRDHQLMGNWKDHRDCHVHPDLVLIYRKPDPSSLEFVRLGSHSELQL